MDATTKGKGRLAEIRRLTDEMDRAATLSEGQFNAIGMLVTDASLAADASALEAAQDGLQWLIRRYPGRDPHTTEEVRGRLLGLIDTTHWALRRLPAALQLSLDPDGHATRFLLAVAADPGLSNQDVAEHLGVDETEVSRLGRRLLAAGVLWRRREWRRNVWDVTPRGRHYLETSGLRAAARAPAADGLPPASPASISMAFAVGVKILPDLLVGVVTDDEAAVLIERQHRISGPLSAREARMELTGFLRDLIDAVPELAEYPHRVGLGIEIGGHVSPDGRRVLRAPNYQGRATWTGYPLARQLETHLGLPTVIENDANALAEFEHAFGAHAGLDCTATLLLDDRIGCGVFVGKQLVRGAGGSAGEIGHIVVEPDGQTCRCGNRGCLDTVAGALAIAEAVDRPDHKVPDLSAAAALVAARDGVATWAVRRAGHALGEALSSLLNLVNPKQIVLYGPPELTARKVPSADLFMSSLRQALKSRAFASAKTGCTIVCRPYEPAAGARAAAAVALVRQKPADAAALSSHSR